MVNLRIRDVGKEAVNIRELAMMNVSLVQDRGMLKWRVNMVRDGRVFGFMRPATAYSPFRI